MRRAEKITLKCFRGATKPVELAFDPKRPIALLFGENGTGKSTIIDAIDIVCNRQVGSLQGRSSASEREHLPSIGHRTGDVSVSFQFGESTWYATYSGNQIRIAGPDGVPTAHVLRRSQLLRLVEAEPSKRYEQLRRFIDVGAVEKGESSLRDALRTAEANLNREADRKTDADRQLQGLWQAEGCPGAPAKTALEWAAERGAADDGELELTVKSIEGLVSRIDALDRASDALDVACRAREAAIQVAKDVDEEQAALEATASRDQVDLVEILRRAAEYLGSPRAPNACPVCQRSIEAATLCREIKERLSRMALADELRCKRDNAARGLEQANAMLANAQAALVRTAVAALAWIDANPVAALQRVPFARGTYRLLTGDAETTAALPQAQDLRAVLSATKPILESDLGIARRDLNLANALRLHHGNIMDANERIQYADALRGALRRALEIVHDERIRFTQKALDKVVDEWNRLYGLVHPDEPVGSLRLYLDENRKGSIHQDGSFCGRAGVAPQGYFSDAHLDTLGFCLFLALAKAAGAGDRILALDDVFTSVDQAHLARISDVLQAESQHFSHVIITTHLRSWQERYRHGVGPAANVQLISLRRWTPERGVCADKAKLAVEDLADTLAVEPLDRRGVASQAGVLLEFVLDHLTLQYRCSLPRTPEGVYTLGALCDGTAKLAKQLRIERPAYPETKSGVVEQPEEVLLKPFIDKVSGITFIRNWVGAHYNALGSDISDGEVEGFGKAVLDLLSALVCPVCGDLARRPDGSYWRCECRKTRMFPLAAP
mgnify:FL=1